MARIKKQYAVKEELLRRMEAVVDTEKWGWFTQFLDDAVEAKLLKDEGRHYPYKAEKDGKQVLFVAPGTYVGLTTCEYVRNADEKKWREV